MEERHLSLSEVARLLGKSQRTIRRWIKSGKLKAYRPGRDYIILESAVRELIENSEAHPKMQRSLFEELPSREGAAEQGPLDTLPESLVDLQQDEFLRVVSAATTDEALIELYRKIDAERTHLEFAWREDESNRKARAAFARSVERRFIVVLTLIERGVRPPDQERASLARQAEQLEEALKGSP